MTQTGNETPGRKRRFLPRPLEFAACVLLAATPFALFVHHNDYSFLKPEILILLAIAVLAGLVFAFLGAAGGLVGRVLVVSMLATLLFDVQLDGASWLQLGGIAVGLALVCWALRLHLPAIATASVATLLISSLVTPARVGWRVEQGPAQAGARRGPPVILHIVLDEQIAVEGIPSVFDPEGRLRSFLEQFYVTRGFRLFGRAFSRYYDSQRSLSNLLNFDHSPSPFGLFPEAFEEGSAMSANAYFDALRANGYDIHAYQTDFMDVCRLDGELVVSRCVTYDLEKIKSIENAPLAVSEKVWIASGMYVRLSLALSELRSAYASLRQRAVVAGFDLPEWPTEVGRVAPLSVMATIDRLSEDLARAEPGSAYYAHLMLPHYPYAYDSDCKLRGSASSWLTAYRGSVFGRRNDPASRALRYPLYLEQVECTHKRLGELLDRFAQTAAGARALVVIHGDHGSRIDLGPPRIQYEKLLSPRDYVDAYSTLFAVKGPGIEPGVDRRSLPLDALFTSQMRDGKIPDGTEWAGPREVYLQMKGLEPMRAKPMVEFSDGDVSVE